MGIKKAKILTFTSVSGGVGKTTCCINFAGIFSKIGKKVLIIDLDLYNSAIAASLNLDTKEDIFTLTNDLKNNSFKTYKDYVSSYNENIDVLSSSKDPRNGYKVNSNIIESIIDTYVNKYDVIIIDTSDDLSELNLVTFDYSDLIIYIINNDSINLKNMKTMTSIFKEMKLDKYRIILNESNNPNKKYYSKSDINNVIETDIDFIIRSNFYIKNIDKYFLQGSIITLNKSLFKKYKADIVDLEEYASNLFDGLCNSNKEEM